MFMLSRINVVWLKRLAWPGIMLAYGLLGLVLLIGTTVNGNKNWIEVGPFFTLQPSEAAKLALALWMATVLAKKAGSSSAGSMPSYRWSRSHWASSDWFLPATTSAPA